MSLNDVVIVGAGEAGGRAALELRKAGYGGRLTLIGEETHAPYERPPLSKAAIVDAETLSPPTIGDGGAARRTQRRADRRRSRRAIDREARAGSNSPTAGGSPTTR